MKKWNGSFKDSKYTETGNIVNDVIENNGRLVHEPTADGYTHEIVDRGGYITEDYYFPNKREGGKGHIHYEIRSTGEVLIDGKKIVYNGGDDKMALKRTRSRKLVLDPDREISRDGLDKETKEKVEEGSRLHELAEKYKSDKTKLENELDKVLSSGFSYEDIKGIIDQINAKLDEIEQQYYDAVAAEQERVQEEIQGNIDVMDEAVDNLDQQVTSLKSVSMEAASSDISAVENEAEAKKQEFIRMKEEYTEKLKLQIQQAEIMRREMQSRRFRGER